MDPIHPSEPVRYAGERRFWNNGFRRAWLADGARHAAAVNAARRGDRAAVEAHAATLGGLPARRKGFVDSVLRAAARLPADLPPHRVAAAGGRRSVLVPRLGWDFRGRRQVARIEWVPMWGVGG